LFVPLEVWMLALVAVVWVASAEAKKPAPLATPGGWVPVGTAGGQCYNPPDFAALGVGDRRLAWNNVRNEMMAQWRGEKGDGMSVDGKVVTDVETALLAKAERVEQVSRDNYEACKKAFGGSGIGEWQSWLVSLPGQLTAGECSTPPLDYTLFDYLSINNSWQINAGVCKGDHYKIVGSTQDYYQIVPNGPWINVEGDPNGKPEPGSPCTTEECKPGMLVMKFTGMSGVSTIYAVGAQRDFTAPEHGKISVMINDANLSDNKYKVEGRLEHHTSIEYGPASK
jgi:hypothetical protein